MHEDIASARLVARPMVNQDLAALEKQNLVKVAGTAKSRVGRDMNLYAVSRAGLAFLDECRRGLIAGGSPFPDDLSGALASFVDDVAFVADKYPEEVRNLVVRRISSIGEARRRAVLELDLGSRVRPYSRWKGHLQTALLAIMEAEAQALAAWIEDEAQVIGGDDAGLKRGMEPCDRLAYIESMSAGTSSVERAVTNTAKPGGDVKPVSKSKTKSGDERSGRQLGEATEEPNEDWRFDTGPWPAPDGTDLDEDESGGRGR